MLEPVDTKEIGSVDFNTALSTAGTQFALATAVDTPGRHDLIGAGLG
ncbi:hypothetical protein [Nocardia sp. NPDC005998]